MTTPVSGVLGVAGVGADWLTRPPEPSTDTGAFADALTGAVADLSARQSRSGELAVAAVTGELADVHAYTIAATEAAVSLEVVSAVRTRAVDAFNEIMRMQG